MLFSSTNKWKDDIRVWLLWLPPDVITENGLLSLTFWLHD